MGNPIHGLGGLSPEDGVRDTEHQIFSRKLAIASLIAVMAIGITTIYLNIQSSSILQTIQNIEEERFQAENFNPQIFPKKTPLIVLIEPFGITQFEYHTPLEITSVTNHHYKVTVSYIEDSIELSKEGKCYLKNFEMGFSQPHSEILLAGGDEKTFDPYFRFNYQDTLHNFSPKAMNRTVLHDVGNMKFLISYQDIQDADNKDSYPINVELAMRIPSEFDYQTHCERLELN